MSTVFALPILYEAVVDFAANEGDDETEFGFGFLALNARILAPGYTRRCIWVPGTSGGNGGEYGGAKYPGSNPRPLATWYETATIYCEAFDATRPRDELAQYDAVRLLHDSIYRAVYHCAQSTDQQIVMANPIWLIDHIQAARGYGIAMDLTVQSMIPDTAYVEREIGMIVASVGTRDEEVMEISMEDDDYVAPEEEP